MPGQTSGNNSVKKAGRKHAESQTVETSTTVSIAHPAGLRPFWAAVRGISPLFLKDRPGDSLLALVVFPFQVAVSYTHLVTGFKAGTVTLDDILLKGAYDVE